MSNDDLSGSVQAAMLELGTFNGNPWYWAAPGRFTNPGLYYWDGTRNVCVFPLSALPAAGGGVEAGKAIEAYVVVGSRGYAYDDPKLSYTHAERELEEANSLGNFKPYRLVTLRATPPSPPVAEAVVGWAELGDWYNMLCHGLMYSHEGDAGNAETAMNDVVGKLAALLHKHGGPAESFRSMAEKSAALTAALRPGAGA